MKKLFVMLIIVVIGFAIFKFIDSQRYPSPDKLPRSNGIIHHPIYGDYPEEIPFEQGMSLMPEQITTFSNIPIRYEEGDFWRDKEREAQGWTIKDKNFSHIIYYDLEKTEWTRCHSCMQFIQIKDAHKCILDTRENTRKRLEEEMHKYKGKKTFISMSPTGKILDYEELYYCNKCIDISWGCE